MLQFQVSSIQDGAVRAKNAAALSQEGDSSAAVLAAAQAVAGAPSKQYIETLSSAWEKELGGWSDSVEEFGENLMLTASDFLATEQGAIGVIHTLLGALTWSDS